MERGMPRPRVFIEKTHTDYGPEWNNRYYPWPYTAADDYIGNSNLSRPTEVIKDKLCGNCGEAIEEELVHLIVSFDPTDDYLWEESGPFHKRCVHQVLTLCPAMANKKCFEKRGLRGKQINQYQHAVAEWSVVGPLLRKAVGLTDDVTL